MNKNNNVSTFLWFEANADQAAKLYCSIFPTAKITESSPQSTSSRSAELLDGAQPARRRR